MRKMVFTITMVLMMLGIFTGASAQTIPTVYCTGLEEADCTFLNQSATAMMGLESAVFDFNLDMNMNNIPESPFEELTVTLTGDGSYSISGEGFDPSLFMPDQMMANMDELPALMESLLKSFNADLNVVLFIPQELIELSSGSSQPVPDKVGFSVRLVDGFGYINLEKLAELDPSGQIPTNWMGMDIATAYRNVLEESLGQLGGMDFSSMMGGFTQPEFMMQFATVERVADIDIDGQGAAVFRTTFDLGGMYSSPEFQDYMRGMFENMMAQSGTESSGAEIDQMLGMVSIIYAGMTMEMTQTIGLDDHYVRGMTMTLDWPLDLQAIMGSMGTSDPSVPSEPLNISVDFSANVSEFNAAPAITAPEDAQIIPLEGILPA